VENTRLAVFDVDGTLLPGTSCERLFFHYLIDNKLLRFRDLFHFGLRGLALLPRGRSYALKANKGYLRGHSYSRMIAIGKEFFAGRVAGRLSGKGIIRLDEHKEKGHRVVLLSGMPEFLLKNFAEHLKIENYRGCGLEIRSDKITGRTAGIFPLSKGKVEIVRSLLKEYNVEWGDVVAYGDHYGDRFLLENVGYPVAVNPDVNLRIVARERNWPVEIFD